MHEPREFQKIVKIPDKTNTFCYYPFYALVFKLYHDGELSHVAPCCMMHDTDHNTILTKNELRGLTPEQIFNHEKFQTLRHNLMNNKKDKHCATCWNLENQGKISHRMYTGWDFDTPFEPSLRELDITLSNKCNLACRMCNIGSSHQLKDDVEKMKKNNTFDLFIKASNHGILSDTLPKDTSSNIIVQWLYKNTNKIKILKISGGEPLYDKNVIKLLKKYVKDKTSSDTMIEMHSNVTLIDDNIIEIMNSFKGQLHTFSIDGSDKVYEYIRHKSNFNLVENNIKNWIHKSKNIKGLNINLVLSALNVGNVVDFLEWIIINFHDKIRCSVYISDVRPHNRGIDIKNLPIRYLEKIKNNFLEFSKIFEKIRQKDMSSPYFFFYERDNFISSLENAIENNNFDNGKYDLFREISLLDKVRNQSYTDYLDDELITILNNFSLSKSS